MRQLPGPRSVRTLVVLFALTLATGALAAPVPPSGFFIREAATGLDTPSAITFGPDGWFYVSSQLGGTVTAFKDLNGDGIADTSAAYTSGLYWPLGMAWHAGYLYVSARGYVVRYQDLDADHVADTADTVITGIPVGNPFNNPHQNNSLVFDSSNRMYLTIGATTNISPPGHPWEATITRFQDDGTFIDVFATGLRNPYGVAINSAGELFSTDNGPGSDFSWICDFSSDELNWIEEGNHYGYPDCFGVGDCEDVTQFCNPPPCGAGDCQQGGGCTAGDTSPIHIFGTHVSPDGLIFGEGFNGFGPNDLFVVEFGQIDQTVCFTNFPSKIVHLTMAENAGQWSVTSQTDFVTGLDRGLDLAISPDSALYVTDWDAGKVYSIKETAAIGVEPDHLPKPLAPLLSVSPNPARLGAHISWESPAAPGPMHFEVFDLAGRRVADLGTVTGSGGSLRWDLRDTIGQRVPKGMYLVRAVAGTGASETRKLMVLD